MAGTAELETAWKNAFSIQSMPEDRSAGFIGTVEQDDGWVYRFFKDNEGDYWFDIWIRKGGDAMTLSESVSGKKRRRGNAPIEGIT